MSYDERIADRIRQVLSAESGVVEKRMFGGLTFMVNGNMCCGVVDRDLMVRVGPDQYSESLTQPHTRKMDFTSKPLKGFVFVATDGFRKDEDLGAWITRALNFVKTLPAK
jgi:TfoX/Sxy family transcriptional regulator of competence genes